LQTKTCQDNFGVLFQNLESELLSNWHTRSYV